MGLYQHLNHTWRSLDPAQLRSRMIAWRQENAVTRIERPTRLDRARALGYKAKPGFILVRVRLARGGRMRPKIRAGRKPKKFRRMKVIDVNYQTVAEQRANKMYPNLEVLNSYEIARDGIYAWYEIILLDKQHPSIQADHRTQWISEPQHRGRVYRGLTSSGKRSRGLLRKGKGAEKVRPSRAANLRHKYRHSSSTSKSSNQP